MTQLPTTASIRPGQPIGRLRFQLFDSSDAMVSGANASSFTSFQLWEQLDQVDFSVGSALSGLSDGTDNSDSKSAGKILNHGYNSYSVDVDITGASGETIFIKGVSATSGEYIVGTQYTFASIPTVSEIDDAIDCASSSSSSSTGYPTAISAVTSGNIQNGSMVTLVTNYGSTNVLRPSLNNYVDSGVMNTRTSGRFDAV